MKDNEKELQLKILEKIMNEMDDYEFDKKLKPKVMSIKVEKAGEGELPDKIQELLGKGEKDAPPEIPETGKEKMSSGEMPLEHQDPSLDQGEEGDNLDSRFARLMAKKKKASSY
jgi:hypothetical protein